MAGPPHARFETTRWSVVLAAGGESSNASDALAFLCEAYWYPLYAFVRRHGHDADAAQDLTQAFFARFIEKRDVQAARRERGRFRAFLLASMKHFLLNEYRRQRAAKRGGGRIPLALEVETADGRYERDLPDTITPEALFDRQWALTVINRALGRLRRQAAEAAKIREFELLKDSLTGDLPHGSYRRVGEALGLSEGAVKVAVHRLRRRFQLALRAEISDTVASAADIEGELEYLLRALTPR